ncbi:hypothetical protein R6Q59_023877 [Mikania micrantha]
MEEPAVAPEITVLNHLDVSIDDYIIKVRILRKWRQPDRKIPNEDYSIEMILIDEEGNKIQAHVLKKWFFRFKKYLTEDACLLIKKTSLRLNLAKNKFVDNSNKVCINYQTYVSKGSDFDSPKYGFSFSSFTSIIDNRVHENVTIDVIGHAVRFFNKDNQSLKDDNSKSRITMQMSSSVFLTLWDHYTKQMFEHMSKHKNAEHLVIILQFGRLKFFNGNPYVSNSYGNEVSRLFLNDDVDDIRTYKKSLMKKVVDLPSSIQLPFGVSMFCSLEDDFLTNTAFTTIGEICEIIEVKCVVLMGTIKAISKDTCWYYMDCEKCNRKVVSTRLKEDGSGDFEDETVYERNNQRCNAKVISPVPRFKIQVRVQDITDVVSLTIFDSDVTKLIHKSDDDFGKYPDELNFLLDKKFAFKIGVSDFNLKNNYQVYGILKIINDSSILSKLDKRVNIIQPNDSDSLNLTMSEFT